jgi:D-hexose-6-phosphate mutarotase
METLSDGSVKVNLTLSNNADTLAVWPHAFRLVYDVHLSSNTLTTTLRIHNTDSHEWECHSLLHTYFRIHDINSLQTTGFKGRMFVNKLANCEVLVEDRVAATIDRETDRVYLGAVDREKQGDFGDIEATFTNAETGNRDTIVVMPTAHLTAPDGAMTTLLPCDVVYWNPWIGTLRGMIVRNMLRFNILCKCADKSRSLADLGEVSYPQFVCIEPGTVSNWIKVAAGHMLVLSQVLN